MVSYSLSTKYWSLFNDLMKTILLILINVFYCIDLNAQIPTTIPWSSSLNLTFAGPGMLPVGYSDFKYTTNPSPDPGFYSVRYSTNDAGHLFYGPFPMSKITEGYKMVAMYNSSFTPKILFGDTIRNLCANSKYLFWAEINNLNTTTCLKPDLTFKVETTSGVGIDSFQTGKIGGPLLKIIFHGIMVIIIRPSHHLFLFMAAFFNYLPVSTTL